jgi:hypothetical protein
VDPGRDQLREYDERRRRGARCARRSSFALRLVDLSPLTPHPFPDPPLRLLAQIEAKMLAAVGEAVKTAALLGAKAGKCFPASTAA